jgi:hypothetical protein
MATWDRGYIVKHSLLGFLQRLTLSALIVLLSGHPTRAASEPTAVATPAAPAAIHLAWDRVGSPTQIRGWSA